MTITLAELAEAVEAEVEYRYESNEMDVPATEIFGDTNTIRVTTSTVGRHGPLSVSLYYDDTELIVIAWDGYVENGRVRLTGSMVTEDVVRAAAGAWL